MAGATVPDGPQRRACVVTGGSSGIGEAVCRRFREAGHAVISVARRPSALEGLVGSVLADLAVEGGAAWSRWLAGGSGRVLSSDADARRGDQVDAPDAWNV